MMLLQVLTLSVVLLFAGSWLGPGASWAQTSKGVPAGTKIDINSATPAELEKLPGVGSATAKKIVAGRPYQSVGDLSGHVPALARYVPDDGVSEARMLDDPKVHESHAMAGEACKEPVPRDGRELLKVV